MAIEFEDEPDDGPEVWEFNGGERVTKKNGWRRYYLDFDGRQERVNLTTVLKPLDDFADAARWHAGDWVADNLDVLIAASREDDE